LIDEMLDREKRKWLDTKEYRKEIKGRGCAEGEWGDVEAALCLIVECF
jgi:hypothetical protein